MLLHSGGPAAGHRQTIYFMRHLAGTTLPQRLAGLAHQAQQNLPLPLTALPLTPFTTGASA